MLTDIVGQICKEIAGSDSDALVQLVGSKVRSVYLLEIISQLQIHRCANDDEVLLSHHLLSSMGERYARATTDSQRMDILCPLVEVPGLTSSKVMCLNLLKRC